MARLSRYWTHVFLPSLLVGTVDWLAIKWYRPEEDWFVVSFFSWAPALALYTLLERSRRP